MAIETIRISAKGKEQLIKLKRYTGIKNWNVLCRWAFCVSLSEPSRPADRPLPADSNVEMTWKTFAGDESEIYLAILKMRCEQDGLGLDETTLNSQFRLHLHRGIGYLAGDPSLRSLSALLSKALPAR